MQFSSLSLIVWLATLIAWISLPSRSFAVTYCRAYPDGPVIEGPLIQPPRELSINRERLLGAVVAPPNPINGLGGR
jgi:hypothetical protein